MNYKNLYYQLAAKVADAIELLISVQQQCEMEFTEYNNTELTVIIKNRGYESDAEPENKNQ